MYCNISNRKPLQWLQVIEEAIRRTPILQHAERKECLFTDGGSTARVQPQLNGLLKPSDDGGGGTKTLIFYCLIWLWVFFKQLNIINEQFESQKHDEMIAF